MVNTPAASGVNLPPRLNATNRDHGFLSPDRDDKIEASDDHAHAQSSLTVLNVTEETFAHKLKPDERAFHDIQQSFMRVKESDEDDVGRIVGTVSANSAEHSEVVARFAAAMDRRSLEIEQTVRRFQASQLSTAPYQQSELRACKAERDLWSLLDFLSMSDLLIDIDESACEQSLHAALEDLPLSASIPDFINTAYAADLRLKKGAVLKEWVERAATDRITDAPAPRGDPWDDTLTRLVREQRLRRTGTGRGVVGRLGLLDTPGGSLPSPAGFDASADGEKCKVGSMHPDAQISPDGLVLALDGVDQLDQEVLLKAVWQLLRAGMVVRAQEIAAEHRLYWLAASLQGVASHYYKPATVGLRDDSDGHGGYDADTYDDAVGADVCCGVTRIGNLKQPIWSRTCWKHADRLSGNSGNMREKAVPGRGGIGGYGAFLTATTGFSAAPTSNGSNNSLSGVLEMSIYAALSNNTKVLSTSPLISCWQDSLWIYLKAVHERNLATIVHRYRCTKAAHSSLYAGCDLAVLSAEREILDWGKPTIGHMSTGNCVQIFNTVPPPCAPSAGTSSFRTMPGTAGITGGTAEAKILQLQAAVMEGTSGIVNHIEGVMIPFLERVASSSAGSLFSTDDVVAVDENTAQLLRVYCHFAIWLKHSPGSSPSSSLPGVQFVPLKDIIPDDAMYLAVEMYVQHLIRSKQRSLVALYAAYLNRPRRIQSYALLLQSLQTSSLSHHQHHQEQLGLDHDIEDRNSRQVSLIQQQSHAASGQSAEAAEMLQLAQAFFPADVLDITRFVVESTADMGRRRRHERSIGGDSSVVKRTAALCLHPSSSASASASASGTTAVKLSRSVSFLLNPDMLDGGDAADESDADAEEEGAAEATPLKLSRHGAGNSTPTAPATPGAGGVRFAGSFNSLRAGVTPRRATSKTGTPFRNLRGRPGTPFRSISAPSPFSHPEPDTDTGSDTCVNQEDGHSPKAGRIPNATSTPSLLGSTPGTPTSTFKVPHTAAANSAAASAASVLNVRPQILSAFSARQLDRSFSGGDSESRAGDDGTRLRVGQNDLRQMEALRWLFFDTTHRIEAVIQTNRCISRLLVESDGAKLAPHVRLLLSDYLPQDAVSLGYSILRQRIQEVEDLEARVAQFKRTSVFNDASAPVSAPASASTSGLTELDGRFTVEQLLQEEASLATRQAELQLEKLVWEGNVARIDFWHSLVEATHFSSQFFDTLGEFHVAADRLLGSTEQMRFSSLATFRARIARTATAATDAIMRTLKCDAHAHSSHDYECPASGFKDIWSLGEKAAEECLLANMNNLRNWHGNYLAQGEAARRNGGGSSCSSNISDKKSRERIIATAHDLMRSASFLYGDKVQMPMQRSQEQEEEEEEKPHGAKSAVLGSIVDVCRDIVNSLSEGGELTEEEKEANANVTNGPQFADESFTSSTAVSADTAQQAGLSSIMGNLGTKDLASGELGDSEELLFVLTSLLKCKQHMIDIRDSCDLKATLLFQLLTMYLQVDNISIAASFFCPLL